MSLFSSLSSQTSSQPESIRWNLAALYPAPNSIELTTDVASVTTQLNQFSQQYKGKLNTQLADALTDYAKIEQQLIKIYAYFGLSTAQNATNAALRQAESRVKEALAAAQAEHLTFLELDIGRMPQAALDAQANHPVVAHHMPFIQQIRQLARYHLSEDVEKALTVRSPFGAHEWADMLDEQIATLLIPFEEKQLQLPELLRILQTEQNPDRRFAAQSALNSTLVQQKITYMQARALNVTVGAKLVEDAQRGYQSPMSSRNLNNQVDDATVEALHQAVASQGAKLAQRYYKLKARWLGLSTLRWSDRNAPMPFADTAHIPYDKACTLVSQAYHAFSPTLGTLADKVLNPANGWVDVPPAPGKDSGAFNYSVSLPEENRSYILLNYLGTHDDVSTLAHEMGHAVHGLLAMEEQGPLMYQPPMAYAETASIFGEMLVFNALLEDCKTDQQRLALYMNKLDHAFNTVVRQISFSMFEQSMFERRKQGKLSESDFATVWQQAAYQFYGQPGEVFTYDNMENLWCYVHHFHRPFYVYAYAFGELFTQSLMAARPSIGNQFEPLYLNMLRAGSTKNAVQLMQPFGLNPQSSDFWLNGLNSSIGNWLTQAENLTETLK